MAGAVILEKSGKVVIRNVGLMLSGDIEAPDLGAGGYYYIHWCTTPTAANEVRAELMVVRADNEAVATAYATYAIIDATETDAYAIANYGLYVGSLRARDRTGDLDLVVDSYGAQGPLVAQ